MRGTRVTGTHSGPGLPQSGYPADAEGLPPPRLGDEDGLLDGLCDGVGLVDGGGGGGGADDGGADDGADDGVGTCVGGEEVTGAGVAVALTYTGGSNVSFGCPSVATFM